MALRRQMFLFASVTCAQEAEAEAERCGASYEADDSLYRDDFQASGFQTADGRGSWLYLLLSWAQTQEQDTQGSVESTVLFFQFCSMRDDFKPRQTANTHSWSEEVDLPNWFLLSQVRADDRATLCLQHPLRLFVASIVSPYNAGVCTDATLCSKS